jgi:diaminopimelate epimerase
MMEYFKVSGSGNDFLALIEPPSLPAQEVIAAWCRRGISLGADGLFALRRVHNGAQMDYFNADGRPAMLCINGTRCAARLAFELGWARATVQIETGAGPVHAQRDGDSRIALALPPPTQAPQERSLEIDGTRYRGLFVTVGVPHLVLLWHEGLANAPVAQLGARLRRHGDFGAAGTNVDFVRFPTPHDLEIRSFERGVEAETLACGTGVLAATVAGLHLGVAALPLDVLTGGGFRLEVTGQAEQGRAIRWALAGDARILSHGELLPEAAVQPPAPQWSS